MQKMKIKSSITQKMFVALAVLFIAFITVILIFQSFFFGEFYLYKKKSSIQSGIEKFKLSYNKTADEEQFKSVIMDFEEKNNAKIAVLNSMGQLRFIIKSNNERADSLKIKIINEIIYEIPDTIEKIKSTGKTVTYTTHKDSNDTQYIVSISPDVKQNEVIFALTSLQPVNEAISAIKEFYLYFYAGAVFIIFILLFIFSRMITKPLININSIASRMAQLDFSKKCEIKSEDEIGSLANSLNILSENLDGALSSLQKANTKLEDDIERERKLEKARKEFVAGVSHELKTPITLIQGYAEGLKDGVFEKKDEGCYLDIILDESNKMSNLVMDMLDLSKLEYGNFTLSKEEFNIGELIESAVKRFNNLSYEKNISVESSLEKNVMVYADWTRIEQVINNYITNAIRHTNKNGRIYITLKSDSSTAAVAIENSGENIPEEELDKIWDNFYKIDKSRNRKDGGTGIGLAIVKNIILLHKGEYGAVNTENGVRFYFTIPRH